MKKNTNFHHAFSWFHHCTAVCRSAYKSMTELRQSKVNLYGGPVADPEICIGRGHIMWRIQIFSWGRNWHVINVFVGGSQSLSIAKLDGGPWPDLLPPSPRSATAEKEFMICASSSCTLCQFFSHAFNCSTTVPHCLFKKAQRYVLWWPVRIITYLNLNGNNLYFTKYEPTKP